jgi:serine phosphatase RsbU (regulator of sigma subunit)
VSDRNRQSRNLVVDQHRQLLGILLNAVDEFARGAVQEDDMTAVLVKRDAGP